MPHETPKRQNPSHLGKSSSIYKSIYFSSLESARPLQLSIEEALPQLPAFSVHEKLCVLLKKGKLILRLCKNVYESQMSFKFILGTYPKDIADVYTNNPKIGENMEHVRSQVFRKRGTRLYSERTEINSAWQGGISHSVWLHSRWLFIEHNVIPLSITLSLHFGRINSLKNP